MELIAKYGPHMLGLIVVILGMVFFVVRFLVGRIYGYCDLLSGKIDGMPGKPGLEQRLRKLELLAAANADNTQIVGHLMGGK